MLNITRIREEQDMSKSELSRRSGIALPVICNLEHGQIHPWPGWKNKLAAALGVEDPEILFQEENEDEE